VVWFAVFHAISAFCNAGFDLFSGLPAFPGGMPDDPITLSIIGGLVLIGSIGFPVIANLVSFPSHKRLSLHTKITLVMVVVLICIGSIGLLLAEGVNQGVLQTEPWHRRIMIAVYQTIVTRTAGFVGIPDFDHLSEASRFLLSILMFIGASPASMGGGMTTGTAATLILIFWGYTRRSSALTVASRTISDRTARRAVAVLMISIFVVATATWLILLTHDTNLDIVLFEVVSAFATCGHTFPFTNQLNLFGQAVIILTMFWGKVGAMTVIVALTRTRAKPIISYPEEHILIG
jgi:trk system potassium uptake protein TrkH